MAYRSLLGYILIRMLLSRKAPSYISFQLAIATVKDTRYHGRAAELTACEVDTNAQR